MNTDVTTMTKLFIFISLRYYYLHQSDALYNVTGNNICNSGNIQKYFQNLNCCYPCVYCPMTNVTDIYISLSLLVKEYFLTIITQPPIAETLQCENTAS
jgi:hypothetical protein